MEAIMNDFENILSRAKTNLNYISGTQLRFGTSLTSEVHNRTPGANDDQFVISWILTGNGHYEEGGVTYPIAGNCYCLRRPGRKYHLFLDDSKSFRAFFDLPNEFYPAFSLMIPELSLIPPVGNVEFSKTMFDEFSSICTDFCKCEITNYYNMLPRLIHYTIDLTGIATERTSSPMLRGRALLDDPYSQITLEEVARKSGMHYDIFRKRFQSQYGITPGKYRIDRRIAEAKNAIASGVPISTVAERLGFADVYIFTHRFKAVTGVSPAQFRRGHIE